MEILLAIVVVSAVIFFGALISIGNELQRKAIDGLREQVVLWAVQDLKIKREHLARTVKATNPSDWLNNIAHKILCYNPKLQIVESLANHLFILCISADGERKIVFTPLSPSDIRRLKRNKHTRLNMLQNNNPLLFLNGNVKSYELSILNCGILFDLELALTWKELTGETLDVANRFWMYEYL